MMYNININEVRIRGKLNHIKSKIMGKPKQAVDYEEITIFILKEKIIIKNEKFQCNCILTQWKIKQSKREIGQI